jgi:hypothetical protein
MYLIDKASIRVPMCARCIQPLRFLLEYPKGFARMVRPVFISYARDASLGHAQALAKKLGDLAFLDTAAIEDGDLFPPRLLDGLLDANVVVIFATKTYSERRFCRLEMRLVLAAGSLAKSHLVLALGENSDAVLNALPEVIADQSWPPADATTRLEELVLLRLKSNLVSLRNTFPEREVRRIAAMFFEEANIPEPLSLHGIVCSLPLGVGESISSRFVGRTDEVRHIHELLSQGSGASARLISRIAAAGGFGKTRLATEYLHRYGPRYYPGGLFWVNAASNSIEEEFWRVLSALDPTVPDIGAMREQKRNIRGELERALRGINRPALYIVDNIPEAAPGEAPLPIEYYCPAPGAVSVLATSRQDTREPSVQTISIDTLSSDTAILLLTEGVPGWSRLEWDEWERITKWIGNLPLAVDLLNRCLALDSVSPEDLRRRVTEPSSASAVAEMDGLSEALRGQVPPDAARGITEAFWISFEKLDDLARIAALILAQLAPDPIPEAFFGAMPEECTSIAVRAALHSRHFVTYGASRSFEVMHRLMADFLRSVARESSQDAAVIAMLSMARAFPNNDDRKNWPQCAALLPHAIAVLDKAPTTISGFDDEGWLAHRKGQLSERVTRYHKKVRQNEESKELWKGITGFGEDEEAARIMAKRFSGFKSEVKFRIMRQALEQPDIKNLQPIRDVLDLQPAAFQNEVRAAVSEATELLAQLRELLAHKDDAAKEEAITKLVAGRLDKFPIHLQTDIGAAYGHLKDKEPMGIIGELLAQEDRADLYRILGITEPVSPPKTKKPWGWLTPWRDK